MIAEPSTPSNLIDVLVVRAAAEADVVPGAGAGVLEPGACSMSCDIWRPLTGRFWTSRSLTLTPMLAELKSIVADLRLNRDRFGHAGRLQRQVQRELLSGNQLKPIELQWSELTERRPNRVNGGPQVGHDIPPLGVGDDRPFFTGALVLDDHGCPRNDRARRIEHHPSKTCIRLRECHGG